MAVTMEALVKIQLEGFNQINNAFNNYKKSPKDRITEPYVEARLQRLEEQWHNFSKCHRQLMEMYSNSDGFESSSYVTKSVYDVTDSIYLDYKIALMTAAKSLAPKPERQAAVTVVAEKSHQPSAIKLPKIVIPTFSGKYTEWVTFRDLFESLIHNNNTIDNVQKMHYLKGYLTGEAEQLLRQTPISDANYKISWDLLKERYNNKRFICQNILKRLLSQRSSVVESASFLKELVDTSTDCLNALKNIGIDVSTWDVIVIHLLTLKLDPETRKQWELTASSDLGTDELPTFQQFKSFCSNRFRALEFVEVKKPFNNNLSPNTLKPRTFHIAQSFQCPFCPEAHKINFCQKFAGLEVDARREFVLTKGLCFNCLGFHSVKVCQNPTTCRVCKRRHHTLLHPNIGTDTNASSSKAVKGVSNIGTLEEDDGVACEVDSQPAVVTSCFSSGNNNQVLLATALISAQSKNGEYYTVRALIDQGSQASFITEATAQYLGLKRETINGNIAGLGGENNIRAKSLVTLNLQSLVFPEVKLSVKAFVLSSVTTLLPAKKVVQLNSIDLQGLQLADPKYHTPNKIDILLGAEVYSKIITEGIKKNKQGTLVAQSTSLGWILSGMVKSAEELSNIVVLHTKITEDDVLKKFWELETDPLPAKNVKWTNEERKCEELFNDTTTRDEDGRYIVKLPFHDDDPGCTYGRSREVAESRFHSLENRLSATSRDLIK